MKEQNEKLSIDMLSDDDSSSIEVLNVVKKSSAKLVMNEIL